MPLMPSARLMPLVNCFGGEKEAALPKFAIQRFPARVNCTVASEEPSEVRLEPM